MEALCVLYKKERRDASNNRRGSGYGPTRRFGVIRDDEAGSHDKGQDGDEPERDRFVSDRDHGAGYFRNELRHAR